MAMQYGGWYDNPETGRNQRWFNGVWTDGSEPGQSSGVQYNAQLDALNAATDRFIDDLIAEAQGDRDFIIRKLDAEHELALGTDNTARAQFLEKVADSLEKRIGRIPYDYEKFTTRELEDYARGSERLQTKTSTALSRLAEDEKVLKETLNKESTLARRNQQEELLSRGLIQGTRDNARGIATVPINELEGQISDRESAIDRAMARDRFDINLENQYGIEDLTRSKERNLADITTQARRGALDEIHANTFGKEQANRAFETQKKRLEQQRATDKLYNSSFATALS